MLTTTIGRSFGRKKLCCFLVVFWVVFFIMGAFPPPLHGHDLVAANSTAVRSVSRAFAYSWGRGNEGQLGHGDTKNHLSPLKIDRLHGVKEISAGESHSLVLMENGDVFAFGNNNKGQLGLGTVSKSVPTPTKIDLDHVEAIAAGHSHTLLLKEGRVYSCGEGANGALGHGDKKNKSYPQLVNAPNLNDVRAIAAGFHYSLALLEDGSVYAFGQNDEGKLGLGDTVQRLTPIRVDLDHVEAIAAGYSHTLLLKEGRVYSCGGGTNGALGHGDTEDRNTPRLIENLENVKSIAAGWGDFLDGSHSLALLENGDVYSCGRGDGGALGHGDYGHRGIPSRMESVKKATAIAAGRNFSLILLENGELYSCGKNDEKQLGVDTDQDKVPVPTRIDHIKEVVSISAGSRHALLISTMVMIGDVDGNGIINVSDAILVLKHIVKLIELKGKDREAADTNKDTSIDVNDAILILKYIVKLIEKF